MRLAILTNILTPYRMALFAELRRQLRDSGGDLSVVVMAETEQERSWTYTDLQSDFTTLLPHASVSLLGSPLHVTRGLGHALEAFAPDVVVCAGSYTLPAVWEVLLRQRLTRGGYRTYFWSESHLNEHHPRALPTRAVREALRHAVYRRFDGFLNPGRMSREFIERYARPHSHLIFFPNTVDDSFYDSRRVSLKEDRDALRAKYGVESVKYVFFTPARLTSVKGLDRLLELAANMSHREDAVFLIAGSGDQEALLRGRSAHLGVDMRLLGTRTVSEVTELYALADCMLLPSLADPSPLAVVEALWMGLPLLVSTHVGNHPEAVRQGENGYTFDYQDPEGATMLLDSLVQANASWASKASAISIQIAQETFRSVDVVERLLSEVGRDLTGAAHPGSVPHLDGE